MQLKLKNIKITTSCSICGLKYWLHVWPHACLSAVARGKYKARKESIKAYSEQCEHAWCEKCFGKSIFSPPVLPGWLNMEFICVSFSVPVID